MSSESSPLLKENTRSNGYRKWLVHGMVVLVVIIVCFACVSFWPHQQKTAIQYRASTTNLPSLTAEAHADFITTLPGLPAECNERQYSGYLKVANGGQLHYWFVESQDNPAEDPVALWMNGGPGGSSLMGLGMEHGPFTINTDGHTLSCNPYSWNRHANMIYLEAPVGVGYSYNTSGIYESGDLATAADNLEGMILFFIRFPHLRKNAFHIMGESYGGVYVPMLATSIVHYNQQGSTLPQHVILLKSFAVGNGINEYISNSQVFYAYYHGLLSSDTWRNLRCACEDIQEFHISNSSIFDVLSPSTTPDECTIVRSQAMMEVMSDHIDTYNIYQSCTVQPDFAGMIKDWTSVKATSSSKFIQPLRLNGLPCFDSTALQTYFSLPSVKAAMHVPAELEWNMLVLTSLQGASLLPLLQHMNLTLNRPMLTYTTDINSVVIPLWKELLKNKIRGLIYHGDLDYMCDFIGGQWAVDSMNLTSSSAHAPWSVDGNTAGFMKTYKEGMTYMTVMDAGHTVPMWKPKESLHLFEQYVLQRS